MKQGWEIKTLGEVCKYVKEQGHYSDLPYIGMEDIESATNIFTGDLKNKSVESATFRFKSGFVLFGRLRPYLRKVLIPSFEGHCSTEIFPILTNSALKAEFLKHWFMLDSTVSLVENTCTGSRMPRANMNDVLNFDIPIPSILEQERIVEILDSAFAKIEALRANAQQNLQNTKDLFQASIENEFKIKSGWTNAQLNSVADVISGYAFKSGDFVDKGMFQVIRIGNVKQDFLRLTESPIFIDSLDQSILCKSLLQQGDLVITQTGTKKKRDYGFVALVNRENLLLNQRVACVRFKDKEINPRYFLYYSYTEKYKNDFFAQEGGAVGQGNVGLTTIKELNVPFPTSKEEQQVIVKKLDALSERCRAMEENYRQTIAHCNALKQALLTEAFNGEL